MIIYKHFKTVKNELFSLKENILELNNTNN